MESQPLQMERISLGTHRCSYSCVGLEWLPYQVKELVTNSQHREQGSWVPEALFHCHRLLYPLGTLQISTGCYGSESRCGDVGVGVAHANGLHLFSIGGL
jgi:hypothetical protein